MQGKQRDDQGTKHTSAGFKKSILSNQIFTVFLHTVHGLSVEAASLILAKPTVHRSETFLHNFYSFDVWDNFLGYRLQKVR